MSKPHVHRWRIAGPSGSETLPAVCGEEGQRMNRHACRRHLWLTDDCGVTP